MSNKLKIGLGVIALLLVTGVFYVFKGNDYLVGAAVDCTQNTCFTSLGVTGTSQVDGAFITNGTVTNGGIVTNNAAVTTNGALVLNSSLTVTTTNTATSTTYLGCINTTATSTATKIKMVFTDTGTTTKAGPNGTTANGFVLWQYGTCP